MEKKQWLDELIMNITEMIMGSGGVLILLLSLVQVAPIKINPWSAILKWIGQQTQAETIQKIDAMQKDLNGIKADLVSLQEEDARKEAQDCRYRILRFADECYLGQKHSQEHFNQILNDISTYERYCTDHPDYPNQVAVIAIDQIKKIYQLTLQSHSFLS